MRKRQSEKKEVGLRKKLGTVIVNLLVPTAICIVVLLFLLGYYAMLCSKVTHNVTVCSEFSIDFKENMDLKMYHYAVGSREQTVLPIEELDTAVEIAHSLSKTTKRKESKRSINNVINYCDNLREKMYAIENTKEYDSRQIQLENNIYVLTSLIQEEVLKYVYYEAGYLSVIEKNMLRGIGFIILIVAVTMCAVIGAVIARYSGLVKEISVPIKRLCDNANEVGKGNFDIAPVNSSIYEIGHLDRGIQKMAQQICLLLEDVKKEEQEQNKIHFQLLQEQINPHFLYNTLDTIVWLVESGKGNEATQMLTNLSTFFRTTLSKGENIISLREEIRHTESYLEIQQVRYRDIMEYEIELPDSIGEVLLPKLTLQPLVENALYHGVKCKRGKSAISVICEDKGEEVHITITDSGMGMTEETLTKIRNSLEQKEPTGFGLRAVQGRIRLHFGESYGITVESEYGVGTKVTVRFPKN